MAMLLFQMMTALGIALVVLVIKARGGEIQFRKHAQIFVFICMILAHLAVCMLDANEVYAGWINFIFVCALARFVYNLHKAKMNGYKLKVTIVNVVFLSSFMFVYILLGFLSIRYTGQLN
jgi:hypothetical protein